jgi:hypothetical protein
MDMILKKLKGYQNTTKETFGKGNTVTYMGKTFNVLDVKEEDIDLYQIARSLSREARYLGHTGGNANSDTNQYSVAQHAVRGSEALLLCGMVEEAYIFLHHDDGESFISDVSSPAKAILKEILSPIEDKIDEIIAKKFGFQYPHPTIIKMIDTNLAQEEMSLLINGGDLAIDFDYWDEKKAMKMYILQHHRILKMLEYDKKEFHKNSNL